MQAPYANLPSLFPPAATLHARSGSCGAEPGHSYTNVNDIIACFHYLNGLGGTRCTAPGNGGPPNVPAYVLCHSGSAEVVAEAWPGAGDVSVSW